MIYHFENPSMNHFERVPADLILNDILTRLDSQQTCIATHVCKKWRALLTPNVVRSLYSPHPLVFSNAFFVELECYDTRDAMYDPDMKTKNVRLVIDMQGRLYRHDIVNTPEFDFEMEPVKAATHNGLIAYMKHFKDIYLINPGVKKGKKIEIPVPLLINPGVKKGKKIKIPASFLEPLLIFETLLPILLDNVQFSGLHFDAATSEFTYVLGYSVPFLTDQTGRALWKYNSGSNTWTNLTEVVNFDNRSVPRCVGVYSWGCFFCYRNDPSFHNRNEERVVGFHIEEQHFFDIEFPQLDDEEERNSQRKKWALKGCDGWVVLVLNVDDAFTKSWRLVRKGDGYGWVQQSTDFWFLDLLCADFYNLDAKQGLYGVNAQGWWCAANCASEVLEFDQDKDYGHFSIHDENGKLKHCIEKSQLISDLGIHDNHIRVRAIWPFQINNICWPRW